MLSNRMHLKPPLCDVRLAELRFYRLQAGCALVARLLAAARVFEIAVKAGYVSR